MMIFKDHNAIFNFRIDVDHFYPKHVQKVLDVAEKFENKMTWFITVENAERFPELVKRIAQTQDIQNHAFFHETFKTEKENYENIEKSHKFFKDLGINVCGFAAPFGNWNEELGKALEKMNYLYSSEFRFESKIFPHFPIINGKNSSVLQLPVHGYSLGDLFNRGYSITQGIKYFEKIIDFFYEKKIPIFLYGHPERRLGKYPQVLEAIFKKIESKDDVYKTSLTDYANFWIKNRIVAPKNPWKDHEIFLKEHSNFFTPLKNKLDLKMFYLFEKLGL